MELLVIERMYLVELLAERDAALAPVQAKLNAAVAAVAERLGIPPEACRIDVAAGTVVDARAVAADDEEGAP